MRNAFSFSFMGFLVWLLKVAGTDRCVRVLAARPEVGRGHPDANQCTAVFSRFNELLPGNGNGLGDGMRVWLVCASAPLLLSTVIPGIVLNLFGGALTS